MPTPTSSFVTGTKPNTELRVINPLHKQPPSASHLAQSEQSIHISAAP